MIMWKWLCSFFKQEKPALKLVCMRQEDTWRWGSNLGEKTPGVCTTCNAPIFFEVQNGWIENKICNRCAQPGSEKLVQAYRDWVSENDQPN